jgi:hypothetical protein
MIYFVHEKLMVWAAWASKKSVGALGYPKECNYTKLVHARSEGVAFTPEMNTEAEEMEACIVALSVTDPHLAQVIRLRYMYQTMSNVQIGKQVGCSDKTACAWIGIAQQKLLGFMNDLAADISLPKHDLKKIA